MAAALVIWSTSSDSLMKVPRDISVDFSPNTKYLSNRVLQKGPNYFIQEYIHEIKSIESEDDVGVDARCWRFMRKNQTPHRLHVDISASKIAESLCPFKAG